MKNTKKVLLGGVAALALVGTSVFGTYMYLTSTTKTVKNIFTVGNVKITLDEKNVDESGKDAEGKYPARDTENAYHIFPGINYEKDPTVHVDPNNEDAYIFVEVVNGISNLEADNGYKLRDEDGREVDGETYATIATQMTTNHWIALGREYPNIYVYDNDGEEDTTGTIVNKDAGDLVVFSNFQIKDGLPNDTTLTSEHDVKVKAFAVQAKGFASAEEAWNAAHFNTDF